MNEETKQKKLSKRTLLSIFIVLIAVPLAVVLGMKLGNRSYYAISLIIIICTMVPFFFSFESRRPQARELVVLAVMCAIAVVSRAAFIALPAFKPITAIIMITGIAFGAESGFLTGAISAFVSNFIFGQGPWTPWQMLAFGMAGFLAGLFFRRGILRKSLLLRSFVGGLVVLVIVGPLLDTCSLFYMTTELTAESVGMIYMAGLPVNAVHAAATVLTLLLLSNPMLNKLERMKTKYGIMDF